MGYDFLSWELGIAISRAGMAHVGAIINSTQQNNTNISKNRHCSVNIKNCYENRATLVSLAWWIRVYYISRLLILVTLIIQAEELAAALAACKGHPVQFDIDVVRTNCPHSIVFWVDCSGLISI